MQLVFVDSNGDEGTITGTWTLEYDGRWEPLVRDRFEQLKQGYLEEHERRDTRDFFLEVVSELPKDTPITTIEVAEGEDGR